MLLGLAWRAVAFLLISFAIGAGADYLLLAGLDHSQLLRWFHVRPCLERDDSGRGGALQAVGGVQLPAHRPEHRLGPWPDDRRHSDHLGVVQHALPPRFHRHHGRDCLPLPVHRGVIAPRTGRAALQFEGYRARDLGPHLHDLLHGLDPIVHHVRADVVHLCGVQHRHAGP